MIGTVAMSADVGTVPPQKATIAGIRGTQTISLAQISLFTSSVLLTSVLRRNFAEDRNPKVLKNFPMKKKSA